jgi:NADH-ubiquinone oxidoreductase chain 1
MSTLTSILFLGGYLIPFIGNFYNPYLSVEGFVLGLKVCFILFFYIWVRASFPRLRYDQLMILCWTGLLPVVLAFVILIPSILIAFNLAL